MSFINDKKSIINEISVINSIGKTAVLPDQNFTLPSVNTKNEPIPFMLDLLTTIIGSEALQRTTGQVMTKFIRNIEPDLKKNLKKQNTTFNSDKQLPAVFVAGYQLPVKKIDLFSKLRTSPTSAEGALLYQQNINSFDQKAYNAIVNPNTIVGFGNLNMSYSDLTDNITFTPVNPAETIGSFTNSFIDNMTIIDEHEFTTTIMNSIFGTISKSTNKNTLFDEEKIKKLLEKISEEDSFATINDEELEELQRLANNKSKGIVPIDVGCSILDSLLNIEDINILINNNIGNDDSLSVGGAYNTAMENSFGRVPQQNNPANKNAIRDGFFKKLIKTILQTIVIAITSTPQIRVLLALVGGFKNGNITFPSSLNDDINSNKNYVNCLAKSAGSLLNEFIFNLLKTELLKIIIPITALLLKEKLQAFIRVIKSLF